MWGSFQLIPTWNTTKCWLYNLFDISYTYLQHSLLPTSPWFFPSCILSISIHTPDVHTHRFLYRYLSMFVCGHACFRIYKHVKQISKCFGHTIMVERQMLHTCGTWQLGWSYFVCLVRNIQRYQGEYIYHMLW